MRNKFKKSVLLLAIIFVAASCHYNAPNALLPQSTVGNYPNRLQVGKNILSVEIVSEINKMEAGLSGRQTLGENEGMLFDFKSPQTDLNFWMKDMLFDIDIIWVADKKIIGITPNVPRPYEPSAQSDGGQAAPIENLPVYSPPSATDQVLEVNAGWSEKNKIKVGDEVQLVN